MQNMFLEIDGLKGESTSEQGKDQIEILSYSHGVAMPLTFGSSNTSRAHGRCTHQDFTVSKYLDLASPTLNAYCCGGNNIAKMTLHVFKADSETGKPVEFVKYTLENVIVTSVAVGGSGGDQPTETVTLNYTKVTWEYIQQKHPDKGGAAGTASTSWDLSKNVEK